MKKTILTLMVAIATMIGASAQTFTVVSTYNVPADYSDAIYISLQAPTEETTDNLSIGLGYSLSVWKGVCVEPNYTMPVSADDNGEREGSFNLGLSYRF